MGALGGNEILGGNEFEQWHNGMKMLEGFVVCMCEKAWVFLPMVFFLLN